METASVNLGVPVLVRVKATAARLGVRVRSLCREIAEGKLNTVRVRGCSCVEESEWQNYIERDKGGEDRL